MKRAIISVYDKTGTAAFAIELEALGYEIISTGGTYKLLKDAGVRAVNVSSVTGFPECLDGRLKTLHPKIHGGLLAMRDNGQHMQQIAELDIAPIDLVAVNLYPFQQVVRDPSAALALAVENIDIGGPTMLRAAAKNYRWVTAVVDPADYGAVIQEIKSAGQV
ncbi:MAG: bifunctional phosphoribosylaminoimidazolecarboxamide formyltransferase/IMP cyclohydrolase, partial [Clostridiales bacterium]|nr:bifunctional phosphoribosylaminoimidazolecarboxamide formyltransferase/IMP cyclohydrolase [Clostridiales bacterium]